MLFNQKNSFRTWVALLFYIGILAFLLISLPLNTPVVPASVLRTIAQGKEPFRAFGAEFAGFKPLLPPHEKVSFIMDEPFNPRGKHIQDLYTAQSFLAPVILSAFPDQRAAIIYCSNRNRADQRLKETGYRLLVALGDGKGIAVKL